MLVLVFSDKNVSEKMSEKAFYMKMVFNTYFRLINKNHAMHF